MHMIIKLAAGHSKLAFDQLTQESIIIDKTINNDFHHHPIVKRSIK